MQLKNRLFPYPILNNNEILSTYLGKCFDLKYALIENETAVLLEGVKFCTNSEYIKSLYENGIIEVVCVIECSQSVSRRCEVVSEQGKTIELAKSDYNGKIEISMFAYAKKDFEMKADEFQSDYRELSFKIDKYDIVAANDGIVFKINHLDMEDNAAKSIFSITVDESLDDEAGYTVSYYGKKIEIYMSRKQFEKYNIVYASQDFKEVFFNMLLVPVLTEALTSIKGELESQADLDDICDKYTWFYSVKRGYKKQYNKELTKSEYLDMSPIVLAQQLLGNPLGYALTNIVKTINEGKESEEDE